LPDGRPIGSQFLKNVIWQGRNQAIHWEENRLNDAVKKCFDKLVKEFDPKFANYMTQSMAFDIVDLPGWTHFSVFRKDLFSLA
jgi:hypothetical protein